ncbi:MAG: hypothetical protein M3203_09320 [Actinomycetota bacterium]|nr:hypothetical protein [Actinomycetota bacterium]
MVETARRLGARAIWFQSGLNPGGEQDPAGCWMAPEDEARARRVVEAAGLAFVAQPFIVDALEELAARRRSS